jgi:hypothetical protein
MVSYAKRKWHEIQTSSKELIAECTSVPPELLHRPAVETDSASKAEADLAWLVQALKEKVSISNRQQQLSLLTLVPQSWTLEKVSAEFGVTMYTARQSRKLQKDLGILPSVPPARGKPLPEETVELVKAFYYDDEMSRVMPGVKDFMSVKERGGKRVHKQRRLLLLNLNELHMLFKQRRPDINVGLSKFCELRPKECVTVGARGTHSVCVCAQYIRM